MKDDAGSSDPTEPNPATPSPSPSPSPPSTNPLASTPSTTPVATSSPSGPAPTATDPGAPPPDFVGMINTVLQGRLGLTKFGLIPSADKQELIAKIWSDPTIQNYYFSNHALLGNPATATTFSGQFGLLINEAMNGQLSDPTVAVDYTNMLQTAGVPLTASEQAALSGATQAINAPVPRPFDSNTISGYDFGQTLPASVGGKNVNPFQAGTDYGTPAGSRIVSPFAGTVTASMNIGGATGFGNVVYVTLDNGWVIGFAHVGSSQVQTGARVNPGDLIAISGQNVGDSTGAVTEVTWQAPGGTWSNGVYTGQYENPHQMMDPIFDGSTFSGIGLPGAAGTGMPTVNSKLDTEYPSIKRDFTQYFGTPPSPEDVYNILAHGSSPQEWTDYIRSMLSHIDGLNQGQAFDLRQLANGVSLSALGHESTDGVVKDLFDQGMTSQKDVQLWYDEHSPNQIDKDTYNKIYKVTRPDSDGILNEKAGADPRDIRNIYNLQDKQRQTGGQSGE